MKNNIVTVVFLLCTDFLSGNLFIGYKSGVTAVNTKER